VSTRPKKVEPTVAELQATITQLRRKIIHLEVAIYSAEKSGDYPDWDFIRAMHPDVDWASVDA
jgi:hypothetical protein